MALKIDFFKVFQKKKKKKKSLNFINIPIIYKLNGYLMTLNLFFMLFLVMIMALNGNCFEK